MHRVHRRLSQTELAIQPVFDPGHIKNMIIYYKTDDLARYTDLSDGAAQFAVVQSADWNLVQANLDKYDYIKLPSWAGLVTALSLNTQRYPTNITDVRQAIVHAINYTDITEKVFFGQSSSLVGPEYPAWKDFYDLGNYTPYAMNLTVAQQYMNKANLGSSLSLSFTTLSGCSYCVEIGQIVQSDLSQIGITVELNVLGPSLYYSVYGTYGFNLQNTQQIGQISVLGGVNWAPAALSPADNWISFVSNNSAYGNWAIYSNPIVQKGVDSFTSSSNISLIKQEVAQAQKQIYDDAPYVWLGVNGLWDISGSFVYDKNLITGYYLDPGWSGMDTAPFFNTVTLA